MNNKYNKINFKINLSFHNKFKNQLIHFNQIKLVKIIYHNNSNILMIYLDLINKIKIIIIIYFKLILLVVDHFQVMIKINHAHLIYFQSNKLKIHKFKLIKLLLIYLF